MKRGLCMLAACLLLTSACARADALRCEETRTPYLYADVLADAEALRAEGVSVETLGRSVDGWPLLALTLGTGDAYALVTAGVHGNENANTPLLMRAFAELWQRYQAGEPLVCDLLARCTLVVVPCVNPDGYADCMAYAAQGRRYYEKGNRNGVNLNRNFPTPYWGNAADDGERDYAGPSAGSEPETQALASLMASLPFSALLDVHSKGRQAYYGKGGFVQADIAVGIPVETLDGMTHTLAEAILPERYRLREQAPASRDGGFGSSTDYAFHLGYPGVTLETLPMDEKGPFTPKLIDREYRLLALPNLLLRLCETALAFDETLHRP